MIPNLMDKSHTDKLKHYIFSLCQLTDKEWCAFEEGLEYIKLKKSEHLLKYGQTEKYIYYVSTGIIRSYLVRDEKEHNVYFCFENQFISSYASFITQQPSECYLQAIKPAEIFRINRNLLMGLYQIFHNAERIGRLFAEKLFVETLEREIDLLNLTAEERYIKLLKQNSSLVHQIPLKHIASYLGIQPESLSRIRKNLK
jgi:CRP-like cAMP-binding protein